MAKLLLTGTMCAKADESLKGDVGVGVYKGIGRSLAWMEAEGNFSEGGLAGLIGSGFKKGCVLEHVTKGF